MNGLYRNEIMCKFKKFKYHIQGNTKAVNVYPSIHELHKILHLTYYNFQVRL